MSTEITLDPSTVQELSVLEASLADVETELTAKQYLMSRDILAQRQHTIAKIPHFWPIVLDKAGDELEAAITPSDAEVLSTALTGLEVLRPEIPPTASVAHSGLDAYGEPRSVTIRFRFAPNAWFDDEVLEKTFWYRFGRDGSAGLVSDPVPIRWKEGKDLTAGLTGAAHALWLAQGRAGQLDDGAVQDEAGRKARDAAARALPEYKQLVALLPGDDDDDVEDVRVTAALSFFNFFGYRGRWVGAAESAAVRAERAERRRAGLPAREKHVHGEGCAHGEGEEDDDEIDYAELAAETFPQGHEVAVAIAEDIWPNAIDYFLAEETDADWSDSEDEDDDDVEMS